MKHARTAPLIRRRDDGTWERLVIGTMKTGPRYEAYVWDHQAWEHRQRLAAAARLLGRPGAAQEERI